MPDHPPQRYDALAFSLLAVTVVLAAWLGIDGPILDAVHAQGFYRFLADWQVLVGALIAIGAAYIAARPVWRQFAELQRQSAQRLYEQLRTRSSELQAELLLVFGITSAIDIWLSHVNVLRNSNPVAGSQPLLIANAVGADDYLGKMIDQFRRNIGPTWGGQLIQDARRSCLDAAYRFSVGLRPLMGRLVPNNRVSLEEIDAALRPLLTLRNAAFESATILHAGIEQEARRIGALISEHEQKLLT
jgi:hypothetical protein